MPTETRLIQSHSNRNFLCQLRSALPNNRTVDNTSILSITAQPNLHSTRGGSIDNPLRICVATFARDLAIRRNRRRGHSRGNVASETNQPLLLLLLVFPRPYESPCVSSRGSRLGPLTLATVRTSRNTSGGILDTSTYSELQSSSNYLPLKTTLNFTDSLAGQSVKGLVSKGPQRCSLYQDFFE